MIEYSKVPMFQYFYERLTIREPSTGLRFFCIALIIAGIFFTSSLVNPNKMYAVPDAEDNLMSTDFTFKPGEYLGNGLTAKGFETSGDGSFGDTEKKAKALG